MNLILSNKFPRTFGAALPVMFRFDFSLDGDENDGSSGTAGSAPVEPHPAESSAPAASTSNAGKFERIDLETLIQKLPPKISYSRLQNGLCRRDLFDSRFQILAEDYENDDAEASAESPTKASFIGQDTDLQAGVYEGGFKTWECSVDLVDYLEAAGVNFKGKTTLELGCGTALPSLAAFRAILAKHGQPPSEQHATFILQDFNQQVLELVTLPNLILTWHMTTQVPEDEQYMAGDLELSDELLQNFRQSLQAHRISLDFLSGSWSAAQTAGPQPYLTSNSVDVVLTSETIYQAENIPSLLRLLRHWPRWPQALCLIAAKKVYFGLSGGEFCFTDEAERAGGSIEELAAVSAAGVDRTILGLHWDAPLSS